METKANTRIMWIGLLAAALLSWPSCSDKKGAEDGNADGDEVEQQDGELEDGDEEPRPCSQDRDCTDGDPCNGNERCDLTLGLCTGGRTLADGTLCSASPRRICLHGTCRESLCGDGFLDPGTDEFCEPPGEEGCDDACLLVCEGDPDCLDDGLLCNGREYCNLDTSRCGRRDAPDEGTVCGIEPRGLCLGRICTESICGDGYLDPGGEEFCEPPYEGDCDALCGLACEGGEDCVDDGSACNGEEYCSVDTSRCARRNPAPAGTVCLTDPRRICAAGLCAPSICGDGFFDPGAGEFCEPPYEGDCDGDCLLACEGDPDCLDDNLFCNGEEYCSVDTSRCGRRNVPPDGTSCGESPDDICVAGSCQTGFCGDGVVSPAEECDDGNDVSGDGCEPATCLFSCHGDEECDDGRSCTGDACDTTGHVCMHEIKPAVTVCRSSSGPCDPEEVCDGVSGDCGPDLFEPAGTACDDKDACTIMDECDGTGTCAGVRIDPLTGAASVSAGRSHSCVLLGGGDVKCWGANDYGQLGDGTTDERTVPGNVTGLGGPADVVEAASSYTCAALASGGIRCWGNNHMGQLGDGTTLERHLPVAVSGTSGQVISLSGYENHTCAVLSSGTVQCWGYNISGQLGDGTTTDSLTPVTVLGLPSAALSVAVGWKHTCALLDTGGVMCWGSNGFGELGDGTGMDSSAPVQVSGLASGAAAVRAGEFFACASLAAGGEVCWGMNNRGQLGDGTIVDSGVPVPVDFGSAVSLISVSTGREFGCAVSSAGEVSCWGDNMYGQLGDGTTILKLTPVAAVGVTPGVTAVDAGFYHACALLSTGSVECWGMNLHGELGDGKPSKVSEAVRVPGLGSGHASLGLGANHSCALEDSGGVVCWGDNDAGQLGDGSRLNSPAPVDVAGLGAAAASLAVGIKHSCAVTAGGALLCWGSNSDGQLGNGSYVGSLLPVSVTGLGSGTAAATAGSAHTCALTDAGGALCWGANASGQLGDGTTVGKTTPQAVSGLGSGVSAIAAGNEHTCALLDSGGVLCWGRNDDGQLGDDTSSNRSSPVSVIGLTESPTAISAGGGHTCVLLASGGMRCWGRNDLGQLGNGTTVGSLTPLPVSGLASAVTAMAAGWNHTCAIQDTKEVQCWGYNVYGQLGDGTRENRSSPSDVVGLEEHPVSVEAGYYHTCVVSDLGGLWCWGLDQSGQVTGFFPGYPHVAGCP